MSKTMDRIANALNLAENAGTPEEAATAMAFAQKLTTLAQIDLAVARQHTVNKEKVEQVEVDHRWQVNPFNRRFNRKYFLDLGAAIAEANDCKVLYGGRDYFLFLTGFPSDFEMVKALFGILAVQMVSECDAALKRGANKTVKSRPKKIRVPIPEDEIDWGGYDVEHDRYYDVAEGVPNDDNYYKERYRGASYPPPKTRVEYVRGEDGKILYEEQVTSSVDGRYYRQNFYDGFIARTRSRLWEAKRAAGHAAGADVESSSTALALRDKTKEVEEKFDERLKVLNPRGTYTSAAPSATVIDAWQHGGDAAERAKLDIDDDNALDATQKKELG